MTPLRLLFAGSGEFGLPTLRALLASSHHLLHIYSQPDRPAGRGRKLTPTPIAQFALDHGLPLTRTENLNAEVLPDADALVVIAFGQKIAPHVTTATRYGAVNLHASLLPRHRGAAPIHHAILADDPITGNSVIRLAEKMDAGNILAQSTLPITDLDTTGDLHDRLAAQGPGLILSVLDQLQHGTATETPQDHAKATIAKKLSRESARLDFTRPARDLALQIRAMYPWPASRVKLLDTTNEEIARLTLVRARAIEGSAAPATITTQGHVGTGAGLLEIIDIQPEGKRPMPLAAYRNGRPWNTGMRLEPLD